MNRLLLSTVYTASQMALGVLVAISIPIFNSQLNKSRAAVDEANARSIYSELSADYLANGGDYTIEVSTDGFTAGTGGKVVVTEADGTTNDFQFNKTCSALTITGGKGETAEPKVELTTNGTSFTFPGNAAGTSSGN